MISHTAMPRASLAAALLCTLLAGLPSPAIALEDGLARELGAAYWRAFPSRWDALIHRCAQFRAAGLPLEDDCKFAREILAGVHGKEAVPGVAWWTAHQDGLQKMLSECGPLDVSRWSNRSNGDDCKIAYHADRALRGLPANPMLNIAGGSQ